MPPTILPTGETLFYTGAASDYSGYSNPEADKLIEATTTAAGQPDHAAHGRLRELHGQDSCRSSSSRRPPATPRRPRIDLISKHLGGFINNVYTNLTPETWYLTK